MKNIKNYYPLLLIIFIFIFGAIFFYFFLPSETKSNGSMAFVTFLVGVLIVYLYIKQKNDGKRDAAKIILQEIRRAEDIISDYKRIRGYHFDKKIIATNSWTKNIHLFVGDLDNDKLDKISDLYSTGEYLDSLIKEISQIRLNDEVEKERKRVEIFAKHQSQYPPQLDGSVYPIAQVSSQLINISFPTISPVWQPILDAISLRIEPIYNSEIVAKLKEIAKID